MVPEDWNGALLLYSHGYLPSFVPIPNEARIAPDEDTEAALLERGYALTGSSYASKGWALPTAASDQLATLDAAIAAMGSPDRVLAYGTSMGGLVTAQPARGPGAPDAHRRRGAGSGCPRGDARPLGGQR